MHMFGGLSENNNLLTISPVIENGIFEKTLYGSLGRSKSKKFPQTISKALLFPNRLPICADNALSISRAITFLETDSKPSVIMPLPAPISKTVSFHKMPEPLISLDISALFPRKFCDSSFRLVLNMADDDASNHNSLIISVSVALSTVIGQLVCLLCHQVIILLSTFLTIPVIGNVT